MKNLQILTQTFSMISIRIWANFRKKINKLTPKYYKVHSELQQCKNFNSPLLIIDLELNAATDLQFSKKETIVLNSVPADITDVLEENICSALPLAGVNVIPNDLRACHQMKSSDRVMVKIKFGQQKNYVMNKCKSVGNKYQERTNLKFSGRLFVSQSMSHKNHQPRVKPCACWYHRRCFGRTFVMHCH